MTTSDEKLHLKVVGRFRNSGSVLLRFALLRDEKFNAYVISPSVVTDDFYDNLTVSKNILIPMDYMSRKASQNYSYWNGLGHKDDSNIVPIREGLPPSMADTSFLGKFHQEEASGSNWEIEDETP